MATAYTDLASAKAAFLANAVYEEEGSATKCATFITACRSLIVLLPASVNKASGTGSQGVTYELERVKEELERARAWLASHGTVGAGAGGGVRHYSLEDFRE